MRPIAATAFLAAGTALSCQSETAVVVDVSTDVPCGRPGHLQTEILVGSASFANAKTSRCDLATGHIGSLVVVPSGADDAAFDVAVVMAVDRDPTACAAPDALPAACIVAKRRERFIPHEIVDLPILLSAACVGVSCSGSTSCLAGTCQPMSTSAGTATASAPVSAPAPATAPAPAPAPASPPAPSPPMPDAGHHGAPTTHGDGDQG
jgi:hypothetical protein